MRSKTWVVFGLHTGTDFKVYFSLAAIVTEKSNRNIKIDKNKQ